MVVVVLGGAWWLRGRPGDGDLPKLAMLLLTAAALGSIVQSWLRIELGNRFRRPLEPLTLTAIGYRAPFPSGTTVPPATTAATGTQRLILAAGPTLAVLVGGLGLASVAAFARPADLWWATWGSLDLSGDWELATVLRVVAWVWLIQAALMGLPIPGSAGRQILCGMVEWAARSRPAAPPTNRVQRRVDRYQGGIAAVLAAAAVWQWQSETVEIGVPAWPFLMALSILVWSGRGGPAAESKPAETSSSRDSNLEDSGRSRFEEPNRAKRRPLSWWGRFRIRRVQRAERGEAIDAMRLDAVLERLHRDGLESLSAADRSILRRVSQRLRQNREGHS